MKQVLILLIVFSWLGLGWGRAQHTADVPGVQAALTTFFEALNEGKPDKMKPLLADSLELMTIMERRGTATLRSTPATDFLGAIGRPREQRWLEVTRDIRVNLDGFLAQAWMDYTFFLGDSLHHCGVNNFTLFYDGEKWVIIHLVDTQRKLDCQ